ncbi:MAG: hypothetical protein AAFU41_06925 [Pseudomonadota bacterium]
MTSQIVLALSSQKASHSWTFGKEVLGALKECDDNLWPDRVGHDETDFRKKLPCQPVDDLESLLATHEDYIEEVGLEDGVPDQFLQRLIWKRAKPLKARGSFHSAWYNRVAWGRLPSRALLKTKYAKRIDHLSLFKRWCALYEPEQAYLHFVTKHVRDEDRAPGDKLAPPGDTERKKDASLRGFLGPLQDEKTFDLGSVNFFSRDWLGETVISNLQNSDIPIIPHANGVLVVLADCLENLEQDFEAFTALRRVAKSIMGVERFDLRD